MVALDSAVLELAEQSTAQANTNDARGLLDCIRMAIGDGTNAGLITNPQHRAVLAYNRNDLVMDTDDSLFINGIDVNGAPNITGGWNLYYED